MKKALTALLVLVMLVPAVHLFAGGQGEKEEKEVEQAAKQEAKQEIVIAIPGDVATWNPYTRNVVIPNSMQRHVFDTLIYVDNDLGTKPGLAVSWEANEDADVWTVKLREGVEFHNGEPFTAHDVVYSFDVCKEDGRGWADSLGNFDSWRAVDDYTVEIETVVPDVLLPSHLRNIAIVSKETLEGKGSDAMEENVVGTGRYKMVDYVKDDRLVLERNEDYWGEKPEIERVTFRPIPQAGTRTASLMSGEVDFVSNVPVRDADMLENRDDVEVLSAPSISAMMFAMGQTEDDPSPNAQMPIESPDDSNPLSVREVRQAIIHSVDEDEIIDKIMGGYATPAETPVPEGFNGYNPNVKKYEYDPEKAEKLLDEAGYPKQDDGYRFEITLDATNDRYINDAAIATAVAGYLEKVGIKCNPNLMSSSVFWGYIRMYEGYNSHFIMSSWSEPSGESALIAKDLLYSAYLDEPKRDGWGGVNRGYYANEEVDDLIEKALSTVDPEERDKIMQKVWEVAWDDAALFTTHFTDAVYAHRNRVEYTPRIDQHIYAWDFKVVE
ncbi:MAG: ABC transporter substrate-binding protein [Spirochaetaceae bacterium]